MAWQYGIDLDSHLPNVCGYDRTTGC